MAPTIVAESVAAAAPDDSAQPPAHHPHQFTADSPAPGSAPEVAAAAAPDVPGVETPAVVEPAPVAPAAVDPMYAQLLARIDSQQAQITTLVQGQTAQPAEKPAQPQSSALGEGVPDVLATMYNKKAGLLGQWEYAAANGTDEQKAQAAAAIPGLKLEIDYIRFQADQGRELAELRNKPQQEQQATAAHDWVAHRLTPEILTAGGYPKLAARMGAGLEASALLKHLDLDGFDPARAQETSGSLNRQLDLIEMSQPDAAPAQVIPPVAIPPAPPNPGAIVVPSNGVAVAAKPEMSFQGKDWKAKLGARLTRNGFVN